MVTAPLVRFSALKGGWSVFPYSFGLFGILSRGYSRVKIAVPPTNKTFGERMNGNFLPVTTPLGSSMESTWGLIWPYLMVYQQRVGIYLSLALLAIIHLFFLLQVYSILSRFLTEFSFLCVTQQVHKHTGSMFKPNIYIHQTFHTIFPDVELHRLYLPYLWNRGLRCPFLSYCSFITFVRIPGFYKTVKPSC